MKKVASWSLAFLLCVLAAELSLQLFAGLLFTEGRDSQPGQAENYRILALGDSNTYGLYLEQHETWPAQFEKRWNDWAETQNDVNAVEVLNLGVPGTNSSRLAQNYESLLETFQPEMTVVMIGFNDWWTPNEPVTTPKQTGLLSWLQSHSRLYRFYILFQANSLSADDYTVMKREISLGSVADEDISEYVAKDIERKKALPKLSESEEQRKSAQSTRVLLGEKEFLLGYDGKKGEPGGFKQLESNLAYIKNIANKKGVQLILLTYTADAKFYKGANQKIREAAEKLDITLIDVQKTVKIVCPETLECVGYFFADLHPRPKGYALVAEAIHQYFITALGSPE